MNLELPCPDFRHRVWIRSTPINPDQSHYFSIAACPSDRSRWPSSTLPSGLFARLVVRAGTLVCPAGPHRSARICCSLNGGTMPVAGFITAITVSYYRLSRAPQHRFSRLVLNWWRLSEQRSRSAQVVAVQCVWWHTCDRNMKYYFFGYRYSGSYGRRFEAYRNSYHG